ncbi:hypothetical protein CVT24_007165 [Panaeolus cyanescens]|uniref:Cytochrome P450 n=1 Tax=Panaeolus cyanescens TaxID=181874 RepID=A0A409YPJ4_9AGAR|nr:hypothetical protein CVT24_007165 [Panaeolus cyanescens]
MLSENFPAFSYFLLFSAFISLGILLEIWRKANRSLPLRGPPSGNLFLGVSRQINLCTRGTLLFEGWVKEYGPVFKIPIVMGGESLVICDPNLASRILAKDTTDYVKGPGMKAIAETVVGKGVVWAEGESHRRQRKSLNPVFNPSGLKEMLPTMYHLAYKLKNQWETLIDTNIVTNFVDVEVHECVDTIGITAFNYEFHALQGEQSLVYRAMRSFNLETPSIVSLICHVATLYIPFAQYLPTGRNNHFANLSIAAEEILAKLLADRRKEHVPTHSGELRYVKSLIEVLLDAETSGGNMAISKDEILAQMKSILMAALDPPSTAIAWVFVELARHPELQTRLRNEIRSFSNAEPTWDQLHGNSLPLLNAVVMEVLRLRGALGETYRRAAIDDVLTLSEPLIDTNGKAIHELFIPKGTDVLIPNRYLNCNVTSWGHDAHEFNPERWIKKDTEANMRLWTFGEGARSCVGKLFAMAEMKILIFVLFRDFTFELPHGPDTPLDYHLDHALPIAGVGLFLAILKHLISRPTPISLRGPARAHWLFGVRDRIGLSPEAKYLFEDWYREYGPVYRIPTFLGGEALVISDPKIASYVLGRDTYDYIKPEALRGIVERAVGKSIVWAEDDVHKRQRRSLNPAFSPMAMRDMIPVMFNLGHEASCHIHMKNGWDKAIDASSDGVAQIEMHDWMLRFTVDCIGSCIFNHQFNGVRGEDSLVLQALSAFNGEQPSVMAILFHIVTLYVPFAGGIPFGRNKYFFNLSISAKKIMDGILAERRNNVGVVEDHKRKKSMIEMLIDGEGEKDDTQVPIGEATSQMQSIMVAGSDPPATALVWAFIELARNPDVQIRLREELTSFANAEPTWNQLHGALPYLDAFVSEVLRLHGSIGETHRVAAQDDVLHLREPIIDASGKAIHEVHVAKGTEVLVPNHFLNCIKSTWGEDGHDFNPERWLREDAQFDEHEHADFGSRARIWTFGEGPRHCIGRTFSMAQMKILLIILLREYSFELPDGPSTPIDYHLSIFQRPKLRDAEGAQVFLKVSRV